MKHKIIKSLTCVKSLSRVYSGGQAFWCGGQIVSLVSGALNIVEAGEVKHVVEEEEDPVLCFTAAPEEEGERVSLVTSHKSGLVRIWSHLRSADTGPSLVRTFRSIHSGPVSVMRVARVGTSSVLATGGSDGSVKVWDLSSQYFTHNLRSPHTVVTLLTFHPRDLLLYVGHTTGALACWDLAQSSLLHTMEAHFSAVTAFAISPDSKRAVSAGRDAVCVVWNLETHTKLSTIPVFSPVEGLVMLEGCERVLLAVEDRLCVWKLEGGAGMKSELRVGSNVTSLSVTEPHTAHLTTTDHNLLTVRVTGTEISLEDTVVGDNDQVLSLTRLGESHLAVACNSPAVRLYDLNTWRCSLSPGHTDTVLAVAGRDGRLVSSSKDNTLRLWRLSGQGGLEALGVGAGHTQSVGGVAWCGDTNVVTVSADTTLKLWSVAEDSLVSVRTEIAHDKDINCVSVSPDGGLVVTGGQDKLAKLWSSRDLSLVSVLRGHTRGVWCAQFSPEDRLVATGSGDATVRLWSITEAAGASCVRQLQGHEASVLSLAWSSGHHLVTGSSDGLMKVWWVSRQECTATLDMGETKVWCLAVDGESVIAGGEGGRLQVWRDDTQEQEAKKQEEEDRVVVQHQRLSNLMQERKWTEAVKLALTLSQPLTALRIIKKLALADLTEAVAGLDDPGLDQLLGYIVQWNTNTRHSTAAQNILHNILANISPDRLIKLPNIQTHVEGLLPYTEKHYSRLQSLNTKTKFIPYLLHAMKATHLPAAT